MSNTAQHHALVTLPQHFSTPESLGHQGTSSSTLSVRSKPSEKRETVSPVANGGVLIRMRNLFKFKEDYRARIHPIVSRFIGYRQSASSAQHKPLPVFPFSLLDRIPLKYEILIFSFVGALGSILLIEAIMSNHTAFQDVYHAPIIISSFGASAVLVFGVIESPLAQPKNLVLGQLVSGIVSVGMTRLWALNGTYMKAFENPDFYAPSFLNGALCMSVSLLAQLLLGILHPPGGATGLAAATEKDVVLLSWNYLPILLASTMIMLCFALFINNLGRRRYPLYWWCPESVFVKGSEEKPCQGDLKMLEEARFCEKESDHLKPEVAHLERPNFEYCACGHIGERPILSEGA